jgi:hypothetical protein
MQTKLPLFQQVDHVRREVLGAEGVQVRLRLQELDELRDLLQMIVKRTERQITGINLPLVLLEIPEHQLPECNSLGIEAGNVLKVIGARFDRAAACELTGIGIVEGPLTPWIIPPRAEVLQLASL